MIFEFISSYGIKYYLHVDIKEKMDGTERVIYYFSKSKGGALEGLPEGFVVAETRGGLPILLPKLED
jgi:hypothetical protein